MVEKDTHKEKIATKEELIGLVQLVIIFTAILAGREIGNIASSYGELNRMAVNLDFTEEAMSNYLRDAMQGKNGTLNVGLAVTIPGFTSTEGHVAQTPDYVRKWLISITLSPIVVTQPEVSDVHLTFQVEGHTIMNRTYPFTREKVGYITFVNRKLPLSIDDEATFKKLVSDAATTHAGEIEITITGRAKANVLFFETMLPFKTTRYPLILPPTLTLTRSGWETTSGSTTTSKVRDLTFIAIALDNPTRVHSITQNVTCRIYLEGEETPVATITTVTTAAPGTRSTYDFNFVPSKPGTYIYSLDSSGFSLASESSPRLLVNP
jgi:hypothetical protein